jgi:hypothetical protein
MSSRNQGPCWDAGDILGWGKAPGIAETLAHWIPSPEAISTSGYTERTGGSPPACWTTRPLPLRSARLPPHPTGPADCPLVHQASALQAHQATVCLPAGPLQAHRLVGPPGHCSPDCHAANPPGYHPPDGPLAQPTWWSCGTPATEGLQHH